MIYLVELAVVRLKSETKLPENTVLFLNIFVDVDSSCLISEESVASLKLNEDENVTVENESKLVFKSGSSVSIVVF